VSDTAQGGALDSGTADAWYRHTTRRLDAMRIIEDQMAVDVGARCTSRLATRRAHALPDVAPVAVMVMGVGVFSLGEDSPAPMPSILDLVREQSRRIDDMSSELESARLELAERKTIDRAKGLLMQTRNMTEQGAYALLRSTAMKQNKRIFEIAEAIVRMADILKAPT
jgi:hypothetical protein